MVVLTKNILETHVLVYFPEENSTGVVPIGRVSGKLKEGSPCRILWDNRKWYPAIFLYSGEHNYVYMQLLAVI